MAKSKQPERSESEQPSKPRGRPKGSKTTEKKFAEAVTSAVCPTCKKSGCTVRKGSRPRVFPVKKTIDGVEYNRLRIDIVECKHCPQKYNRRLYENI